MRLTELNPRWVHPNILAFDCPCCKKVILTCKDIEMGVCDQMDIFVKHFGEGNGLTIVPCKKEQSWKIENRDDFNTLTAAPSLDASAAGHWHGFIRNGEII